MSSGSVDSTTSAIDSDTEQLKRLLRRLHPGDQIEYETSTGREGSHKVVETAIEDGYYRVYAEGSQGGRYLLMPEKRDGMGDHPVPEAFWVNQDPDENNTPYELVTRGSILSLSITASREL
ncbi:hypothetical protein [Halorussus litoreus]|uniref:hypothetical protein n=1 Tax=Halorussus litoreus TaxID=1710536 RepID=UPI0013007F56|nr:hypothetical protein [Halorussus litoreus]